MISPISLFDKTQFCWEYDFAMSKDLDAALKG
jgi:hypothetical protein